MDDEERDRRIESYYHESARTLAKLLVDREDEIEDLYTQIGWLQYEIKRLTGYPKK